jgi:hypothetical protein
MTEIAGNSILLMNRPLPLPDGLGKLAAKIYMAYYTRNGFLFRPNASRIGDQYSRPKYYTYKSFPEHNPVFFTSVPGFMV